MIGRTSIELNFWDRPEDRANFVDAVRTRGSVRNLEIVFRTKSGERRAGLDSAEAIEIGGEKCVFAIFKDVTEQRAVEKQLRQAQKMEAIGQLRSIEACSQRRTKRSFSSPFTVEPSG